VLSICIQTNFAYKEHFLRCRAFQQRCSRDWGRLAQLLPRPPFQELHPFPIPQAHSGPESAIQATGTVYLNWQKVFRLNTALRRLPNRGWRALRRIQQAPGKLARRACGLLPWHVDRHL